MVRWTFHVRVHTDNLMGIYVTGENALGQCQVASLRCELHCIKRWKIWAHRARGNISLHRLACSRTQDWMVKYILVSIFMMGSNGKSRHLSLMGKSEIEISWERLQYNGTMLFSMLWRLLSLIFCSCVVIQSQYMTEKYHIYMLKSGRISMCGLTPSNVEYVAKAIHETVTGLPQW